MPDPTGFHVGGPNHWWNIVFRWMEPRWFCILSVILKSGDSRVGRSKESMSQLLTSAYPALTCDVLRVFLEVLTQFYNVRFKG